VAHLPSASLLLRHARRLAGAAVLCAAVGCSATAGDSPYFGKTEPPEGQHLRYISGSEPESLDPQVGTSQPDARIIMAMFDGLTEYDPQTGQPIPALAERWEPNEDNSAFTFHLRQAVWSDGTPITADDFAFSVRAGAPRRARLYLVPRGSPDRDGRGGRLSLEWRPLATDYRARARGDSRTGA